jgi:hypothetical protein
LIQGRRRVIRGDPLNNYIGNLKVCSAIVQHSVVFELILFVMQFYFAGSFAGNSSFKAVLAASPALFTAHYREWCPRIIRQTISVVSFSKLDTAIMRFCTSLPS